LLWAELMEYLMLGTSDRSENDSVECSRLLHRTFRIRLIATAETRLRTATNRQQQKQAAYEGTVNTNGTVNSNG